MIGVRFAGQRVRLTEIGVGRPKQANADREKSRDTGAFDMVEQKLHGRGPGIAWPRSAHRQAGSGPALHGRSTQRCATEKPMSISAAGPGRVGCRWIQRAPCWRQEYA